MPSIFRITISPHYCPKLITANSNDFLYIVIIASDFLGTLAVGWRSPKEWLFKLIPSSSLSPRKVQGVTAMYPMPHVLIPDRRKST